MKFIRRHSVFLYFLLTFVISWGGIILTIGGFDKLTVRTEKFNNLLPLVILAILAGPSLTGIVMTTLVGGKNGLKEFFNRLFKRKIQPKWYSIALFTGPLLMAATYLFLSLFSGIFLPGLFAVENKIPHIIAGLMTGLVAGLFEEIGWTGFAIPNLKKRYGILKVGLIVGLIWSLWHTLPGLWLGYASGTVTNIPLLLSYFADSFLFLTVYRILMVWVYDMTGSLFVAMIMHGSLTAAARIFTPLGIVGFQLIIFDITWVVVLSIITFKLLRIHKT